MAQEGFFVHQFELGPWDNFVYLIGDKATRECAVVDPAWHAPAILAEAEKLDVKITHMLCTHSHFDHVNRVDEILNATDAQVHMLGAEVDHGDFKCENLVRHAPGDVLTVGKHAEITFVHTPGHTPGSTCYKLRDSLVTGDTLFVEGCGRCDFVGGDPETMHQTIHELVRSMPGETALYPGHNYGSMVSSTLDHELAKNPYLQLATVDDFVAHRMEGKTRNTVLPEITIEWEPESE
jgi:hydroxyacylglutathione hydrolase